MAGIALEFAHQRHVAAIQRYASDPAIGALSNVPTPYPADGAEQWLAWAEGERDAGTGIHFAVTLDGQCIGSCGLTGIDGKVRRCQFGYWIAKPFWGKGYATEAGPQALQYGFDELPVDTVEACCLLRNPASLRVLEKLGFNKFAETSNGCDPKWPADELIGHFRLNRAQWQAQHSQAA